eukprot:TRINITY_DN12969_c0_g1_i1.p1 TRINITY_DN12969_c0_g1~~TRINITY_DN12969_c0_g1_i1.p1  ORF type:complete len:281 (-),score=35.33 TRINITY_DN12969_c0_g1_i1:112-954(-)
MSSFGFELEICCWVNPLELLPSFSDESPHIDHETELLLAEVPCSIIPILPVAFHNEVPYMENFLPSESKSGHTPPYSHVRTPSSGVVTAPSPEVTVLCPPPHEASIIVQPTSSDSPLVTIREELIQAASGEPVDGSDTEYTEDGGTSPSDPDSEIDVSKGVKLGTSKSPVIEAFVYCALKGWGVQIKRCTRNEVEFIVTDFDYYYNCSNRICSKQRPTEDISARIKGLKRWFPDFPARKAQISGTFTVSVGKGHNKIHKIRKIMNKNRELIGICKLRRNR